ncbi:IS1634 family transposase [Nakamurella multipartita]|uniref:Transposase-like protein n=1 Tax=Nakamurella multipartita (strain ATCC 700099 / DSM 44233 / CIP 104796 / JCM 9543 / NBRC 105858 / Y-104) TaxID=479431 RepID=C8X7J8_NAKMY|nr:IS1634 family transposase [Nakamurella multipartita]ACV78951.1 Transposase-like protein [Nakamurella multipartita DSM 44233]ACV79002.1 Transposase-like protein [Nakamurella multipartita DSM 44233]
MGEAGGGSGAEAGFGLVSQRLGPLPLINHFLDRIGLDAALDRWLPEPDRRFKLTPAAAIRLLVVNLLVGRAPLYGLGEWAAGYPPALLGLPGPDTAWLNDDRIGRALVALFDADRASLLTELIVGVVDEFGVDTAEMHNDSTSVSVHGQYKQADGTPRRGKPTPAVTFGHSKDHRPDLKQLVWILTVSADGSVPMAYRLADGNTSDDPTHIPTWDGLVKVVGRRDFLYVADSKLCSGQAMRHIDGQGGRFVTVLPRTRGEDKWFRDWIGTNQPAWTEAIRLPGQRIGDLPRVWSTFPAPLPSAEGYRIIWVHSTVKAARDEHARRSRIEAGAAAVDELAGRLAGPKTRLKTRAAVEQAITTVLTDTGSARWLQVTVTESIEEGFRQEKRGRPGADTRYRRTTRTRYTVSWRSRDDAIAHDTASDGCFPMITNDRHLTDQEVLAAYRYQPNLERRHHVLKSVQDADPIWLRDPARIEAIFCCQFLALLVGALIERQIRTAMKAAATTNIPLYPELRACEAPTAERIFAVLADLTRHELHRDGELVQAFEPELTPLQQQILDLLGVSATAYRPS